MNHSLKRSSAIDALRGFSLLGILMANMLIFQYGIFGKEEMHLFDVSYLDSVSHDLLKVFVEGSFMPIFTFLFGYSLIKMKESLNAKGLKFGRNAIRRSVFLICLGLLHSIFLWEGDILFFYGGISLFLLLFVNRKPKTLLIWAGVFMLLSLFLSYGSAASTPEEVQRMKTYVTESLSVYGSGTYGEIMHFRMNEDPLGLPDWMLVVILLLAPLLFAALFLLGMAAAKRGSFMEPEQEQNRLKTLALFLIPIGLAAKTCGVVLGSDHPWNGTLLTGGGQILALGYIYGFGCLYARSSGKSIMFPAFEAVGRLSLSNYLMQSVICVLLFYGFGLGWFGELGVLPGILLSLLIYACQAAISLFWMRRFRTGPVEQLLRMGTYWSLRGRPVPITSSKKEAAGHPSADPASV